MPALAAEGAARRPAQPLEAGRPLVGLAGAGACLLLLVLLHARNSLDGDEGVVLNGAWNLVNGRVLYVDFFEFLPPGSFYLVVAAWKTLGDGYWTAKGVGIAALAVAAVGVWRIGALVAPQPSRPVPQAALLAGPLLFCLFSGYWPTINHNAFHMPLAVWSTYFLLRGLQTQSWRPHAAAGLLCGAGVWFLQHRSALMAAAALLVLIGVAATDGRAGRWRGPAAYLGAFLVPLLGLLLLWPPSLLFQNLIVFPATHYLDVNVVEPTLFLWTASFVLAGAWLLRNRGHATVRLLLMLQAALLLGALQRPDPSHVTAALFPLLALLPALAGDDMAWRQRALKLAVAAGLASLTLPLVALAATNRALLLTDWSRHPALEFVRARCGPSPSLYAGPFAPGLYYETRRLNPTRYSILLPRLHTDAQFAQARADLAEHPPPCILSHYGVAQKFGYSKDNPVDRWIAANYHVIFEFRGLQVWTREQRQMPGVGTDGALAPVALPPVAPTPAAGTAAR